MCFHWQSLLLRKVINLAQDLSAVAEYGQQVQAYYAERGSAAATWEDAIRKTLCKPVRPHMLPFAQQQGLIKR